jgi:hypothetical protein
MNTDIYLQYKTMDMVSQRPSKNLCLCLKEEENMEEDELPTIANEWLTTPLPSFPYLLFCHLEHLVISSERLK